MNSFIKNRLISHFNCEIRQNGEDKIFFIRGNKKYTNKDILEEIINESNVAEELIADLISATCYRLERFETSKVREKIGNKYYYLTETFTVGEGIESMRPEDNKLWTSGNYYNSKESVIKIINFIKLCQKEN